MADHSDLLLKAKQHQKDLLKQSEIYNANIQHILELLVKHNSKNDSNGPSVLDKITTIHQLDKEIDRQFDSNIVPNFNLLQAESTKLRKKLDKILHYMELKPATPSFQARAEHIDQELRILEKTLDIIKENNT